MNTLAPGDEREPRRSVPLSSVAVFVLLNGIAALPVIVLDRALGDFVQRHDLARLAIWLAIFVPLSMLSCRVFLTVFPLPVGEIEAKSRGEFAYCVYMLFMIVVVPLLYLSFLPFPLRRYTYILLGARIGKNTHCPGRILDP
ncbi:MAG: hypothetical protein H7Y20_03200, partial [Bryobacteraceae bacterium]|nr:hypothetical protein [Bryobacteraceae bacterium]